MDPLNNLLRQLTNVPFIALNLDFGVVCAILQKCLLLIIRIEGLLAVLTFGLELVEMIGVGIVQILVLFEALIVFVYRMTVTL